MATCRHCAKAQYHDYQDQHGIRCPLCGEKEAQPKKVEQVVAEPVRTEAPRRATRASRSK